MSVWKPDRDAVIRNFWRYVEKTESCWLWVGGKTHNGYGKFRDGVIGKAVRAHRYSWEIVNGPIPDGLFVLHNCDTKHCVNPNHLYLGTEEDNKRDMKERLGSIEHDIYGRFTFKSKKK